MIRKLFIARKGRKRLFTTAITFIFILKRKLLKCTYNLILYLLWLGAFVHVHSQVNWQCVHIHRSIALDVYQVSLHSLLDIVRSLQTAAIISAAYTHTCTHAHLHIYTHIATHICMHQHKHTYTHIWFIMHAQAHIHKHTYTHTVIDNIELTIWFLSILQWTNQLIISGCGCINLHFPE